MWRALRPNKEDRIAKLEWAPNGGLGRVLIGKVCMIFTCRLDKERRAYLIFIVQHSLRMADLARPDPSIYVRIPSDQSLILPFLLCEWPWSGCALFHRTRWSSISLETEYHKRRHCGRLQFIVPSYISYS